MRLPRLVPRLAMTQKGYPICHCEERSDVAISCAQSVVPARDCHTQCAHWVRNDMVEICTQSVVPAPAGTCPRPTEEVRYLRRG